MVFVEKIKREALVKRRMALIGIGLAGLISSFSHADDGYAAYEVLTSKSWPISLFSLSKVLLVLCGPISWGIKRQVRHFY